jgi:hypothetical protein
VTEVLLFHHAQGLTPGCLGFADELRAAGNVVQTPDLLAQTRSGAQGALLFHACLPTSEFGGTWPPGVPLQIHTMDADEWVELDAR